MISEEELEQSPVRVGICIFNAPVESIWSLSKKKDGTDAALYLSSSIDRSSSFSWLDSRLISMPHSRITLRYLPARSILCFHRSRTVGIQAPPGRRPPTERGGGTPAWCCFDEPPTVDPSLNYRRSLSQASKSRERINFALTV